MRFLHGIITTAHAAGTFDGIVLVASGDRVLYRRAVGLAFEPGTRFQYSNTDYHILGRVIEALTGQSYAAALQERILAPLGMHETALVRQDQRWATFRPTDASSAAA